MSPRHVFIRIKAIAKWINKCGHENMLRAALRAHKRTPVVWNKPKNSLLISAISFPLNDSISYLRGTMQRSSATNVFLFWQAVKNNSCELLDGRNDKSLWNYVTGTSLRPGILTNPLTCQTTVTTGLVWLWSDSYSLWGLWLLWT